MKPQITITIDGPQGAGKTTVAHYLAYHLKHMHGVGVTLQDDRQFQEPNLADLPEHFDAAVAFVVVQK